MYTERHCIFSESPMLNIGESSSRRNQEIPLGPIEDVSQDNLDLGADDHFPELAAYIADAEAEGLLSLGAVAGLSRADLLRAVRSAVITVSRLGYGCMGLTGVYNDPLPEEEGIAVILDAFKKGITFFDTSDFYGINHANEYLVGKALKLIPREKVQLAIKFGIVKIDQGQMIIKGTPEYVRSCCEASLKRLDVDCIDLFYVHRIDATIPIEVTMSELEKLVEEGKIKYIGLSEASPDTIRRAHAIHPISAI